MKNLAFLALITSDAVLLFFLSTFCAHLLLSCMEGDSVDLLVGRAEQSKESIQELKKNRGLGEGFTGVMTSYLYSLQKTWKQSTGMFRQTSSRIDMEDNTVRNVIVYSQPTLLITIVSLAVYLALTWVFSLIDYLHGVSRILMRILLLSLVLFSTVPIFASGKFLLKLLTQYDQMPTWDYAMEKGGIYLIGIFVLWSILQGLGDGAFIEGVRGFKEEIAKIMIQPYILFQQLNGGNVRLHVLKNLLPYLFSISYFRFIQLLGGTIVLEYVFNIKGLGFYTKQAVRDRDTAALFAITAFTMLCVCAASIMHRVLIRVIDPRHEEP
jgi:ABC-type dipeptide/oligopeptide/nickel transport system permease component